MFKLNDKKEWSFDADFGPIYIRQGTAQAIPDMLENRELTAFFNDNS